MLRVATYNIHRYRGLDRRVLPLRIAAVLQEVAADVVALQEVVATADDGSAGEELVRLLARAGGYHYCFGETRKLKGRGFGNALFSRLPLRSYQNYDLSWRRSERRGCLRADLALRDGSLLHVFNAHLGTAYLERRQQARLLVSRDILTNPGLSGPRIVLGDFNEWTRGLTTRLLSAHLQSVDLRAFLRRARTYPGVLPLLHLDHVYFDKPLRLTSFAIHRSRTALIASDHLPLIAEFELPG